MAETIVAPKAKSSKRKPARQSKTNQPIPLEQRTDVTVDELQKMSLQFPAELYNGRVDYKLPNLEHGFIQLNFATELKLYLRQNPIGIVMVETNFKLWSDRPKESRIPDVAFIKKERIPTNWRSFPLMAPDIAIEIISPEDNFFRVMNKVDAYLEQGSEIVWLVISETREVLVCTKEKKTSEKDTVTAPDLLPGFALPVEKIFEGVPLPERKIPAEE